MNRTPHTVGGGIGSVKIRAVREATIRAQHAATVASMALVAKAAEQASADAQWRSVLVTPSPQEPLVWDDVADLPVHGMCTRCGAIEVPLVEVTGHRDFSEIGESACYPTGYGCELCS